MMKSLKFRHSLFILVILVLQVSSQPLQLYYATLNENGAGSGSALSGSLRGGTNIYINGLGFPKNPNDLQVFIGNYPCSIPGEGVTTNFLVCETTDSGSSRDIKNLPIQILVEGKSLYTLTGYSFSYLFSRTPYINYVFPSSSIANQNQYFWGTHRVSDFGDGGRNIGELIQFSVGEDNCRVIEVPQHILPNYIRCIPSAGETAGRTNVSEKVDAGRAMKAEGMRRSSFDADDYHEHTIIPTVTSVSRNSGLMNGQHLVIKGTSFSEIPQNNSITVDDTDCLVENATNTEIHCKLAAKETPIGSSRLNSSVDNSSQSNGFIGGSGLKYTRYNIGSLEHKNIFYLRDQLNGGRVLPILEESVRGSLETYDVFGGYYGEVWKGYFLAPVDGEYIFRGAADDNFALFLSSEYGTEGYLQRQIFASGHAQSSSNYYISNQTTAFSSPVYLEQGKYYYLQAYHVNLGGHGWMKIEAEMPNNDTTLKWQRHEVNQFRTTFTNDPQEMQFKISNFNASLGGAFKLQIVRQDRDTLEYHIQSVTIGWNATAANFAANIHRFDVYNPYSVSGVSATSYDENGNVTDNVAEIVERRWVISIWQPRQYYHLMQRLKFVQHTLTGIGEQARETGDNETDSGNDTVGWNETDYNETENNGTENNETENNGTTNDTEDTNETTDNESTLNFGDLFGEEEDYSNIHDPDAPPEEEPIDLVIYSEERIHPHGPLIGGTFKLYIGDYPVGLWNRYTGKYDNYDISSHIGAAELQGAFRQIPGFENTDVYQRGDFNWGAQWIINFWRVNLDLPDLVFDESNLRGGKAGTQPHIHFFQTRKYSSNLLFSPLTEEFLFQSASSPQVIVTVNSIPSACATNTDCSYTFIEDVPEITLQSVSGSMLSVEMTNPQNLNFSDSEMFAVTVDGQACEGGLECQLAVNEDGSLKVRAGEHDAVVRVQELGYVSVSGTTVKIVQSLQLEAFETSYFGNNGGYEVTVSGHGLPFSTEDEFTLTLCNVEPQIISISNTHITFLAPQCASTSSEPLTLDFANQSSTIQFTYTAPSSPATLISISPHSNSPVLKGVMTITGSGFGSDKSVMRVHLLNATGKVYEMRILEINDTVIKCGIPGGREGRYDVRVARNGEGDIVPVDEDVDDFVYELVIESISPQQGPHYGGTLLTITGRNFSPNQYENLVFVSNRINWFCSLQSYTPTQITCRTPKAHDVWQERNQTTQPVTISSKLIQDSSCEGDCMFTYYDKEDSPYLERISSGGSYYSGRGTIVLEGIGFRNQNFTGDLYVAFMDKESEKVTAVPVLPENLDENETTITIGTPALPAGSYAVRVRMDTYGETNPISITIHSEFYPNAYEGSTEGGEIVLKGRGFPNEWPAKLWTLTVVSGGVGYDAEVLSSAVGEMRLRVGPGAHGKVYRLSLKNPLKKTITATFTHKDSATPKATILTPSPSSTPVQQIQLNLTTPDLPNLSPSLAGIYSTLAPETTIHSTTDINVDIGTGEITFTLDEVRAGGYGVKIFFEGYGWAKVQGRIDVEASGSYTSAEGAVGYAGGRIVVTGDISDSAEIRVAGVRGQVVEVNGGSATFEVPKMITPTTIEAFPSLSKPQKLTPVNILTEQTENPISASFISDGKHSTIYTSPQSGECYIGFDFGENFLVKASRIRYFPYGKWPVVSNYLLGGIFEASVDGSSYTEIGQVDLTVSAGWNSFLVVEEDMYRFFRFRHNQVSRCRIAELQIYGVLMDDLTITNIGSYTTDMIFSDGYNQQIFTNAIQYRIDKTPIITEISPKTGSIYGGETITITGTSLNFGDIEVEIDGIACEVSSSSSTEIQCVTGERLTLPEEGEGEGSFSVRVGGNLAILSSQSCRFEYVMRWSDERTWGVDMPPIDNDLVYIPKGMKLFVDISPPFLEGVIVEDGALIFSDESDITFRTNFITLNGGEFRAGTVQQPYQHQLNLVMHGHYYWKQQPMFGNKGIGCLECKFSLHGRVRDKTWTTLSGTISPGDNTLSLTDSVDWASGEEIVVASSSFDHNQAERRTITQITGGNLITVDQPFKFKHYSGIETHGTDILEMRAEVGLLTRNIKMKGDDSSITIDGEYGSHLMMAGSAENGMVSHIAYTEFFHCGQPRIVGRYCIHFHMNGDVIDSFVKGNAVHDSFARILTLHGIKYLHVSENVGYRVKGHNFFIEDGIETMNLLENNLVIGSLESWNMMQTDISVASYWVTNPTNNLRNNHAAGGDFYGFWYEIKSRPDGPSATSGVCPMGNPLGESHDNVAHSYKRFGLRIFTLTARVNPCGGGQSIESKFYNYVIYKNRESGVLAEFVGHMIFENFVVAESLGSGFNFFATDSSPEKTKVKNSAIIGQSTGNPGGISGSIGIVTPKTQSFLITNVRFHSFPSGTTIIKLCSGCDSPTSFISKSLQYFTEQLSFTDVSGRFLTYAAQKKDILYDLDGSFSEQFDGATRSRATFVNNFYHLNEDVGCHDVTDGRWSGVLMCDDTVEVGRVMITGIAPVYEFKEAPMYFKTMQTMEEPLEEYATDYTKIFSFFGGKQSKKLPMTYAMPFVAGRIYSVWSFAYLDISKMQIQVSKMFNSDTPAIVFRFNYTQSYELFDVGHQIGNFYTQQNITALTVNDTMDQQSCNNGDYFYDVDNKTISVCLSGKKQHGLNQHVSISAIYCRYTCPVRNETLIIVKEDFYRLWSNVTQWPGGRLPVDGENVTIPGNWTIMMDIDPAEMEFFYVDGDVIIPNDNEQIHIKASSVWVRAGSITAGTKEEPYSGDLTFEIIGNKNDMWYWFNPTLMNNKIFAVSGKVEMHGVAPETTWTYLQAMVYPGDDTIVVGSSSGWQIGDQLVIAPSFSSPHHHETVTIISITGNTITFEPNLRFQHYGDIAQTINNQFGILDTRAGVGHLSRNIRFISGEDVNWGYFMNVFGENDAGTIRRGQVILDGVQFIGGGQKDSENPTLKLSNVDDIEISNSVFEDCVAGCIDTQGVQNSVYLSNVFYNATRFHLKALSMSNYTVNNNLMIYVTKPRVKEIVSCFMTWTDFDGVSKVYGNLCQGSTVQGLTLPLLPCGSMDNPPYWNNTVGSCSEVGVLFSNIGAGCKAMVGVRAYACGIGQICSPAGTGSLRVKQFMIADCGRAVSLRFGGNGIDKPAYFEDSFITAISRPECSDCYGSGKIDCSGNQAVRLLTITINGENVPSTFGAKFDTICKEEVFDAKVYGSNVVFENYRRSYEQLPQCGFNILFRPHPLASDLTGSHNFWNTYCNNCQLESLAYFQPPNPRFGGWFGGCGNILCTGMHNYAIRDWTGTLFGFEGTAFGHPQIGSKTDNCVFYPSLNGYVCDRTDFAVLEYESIAPDRQTRIMWPVYLKYEGGRWNSSTNGWREWQWQGSEPMNKRIGRFISLLELYKKYNMTMESEPPIDMRLQFQKRNPEGDASQWIIVKLHYPRPNMIRIRVGRSDIEPISLLDNNGDTDLNTSQCGSNKYFYFNYTIHFVITGAPGCMVRVSLTNSIQLTARFAMLISEFFIEDGKTLFIDRMVALLGINDYSRVKVVGIYSGSVIVQAFITEPVTTDEDNATLNDNLGQGREMRNLYERINELYDSGEMSEALMVGGGLGPLEDLETSVYVIQEEEDMSPKEEQDLTVLIAVTVVSGIVFILLVVFFVIYMIRKRALVHQMVRPSESEKRKLADDDTMGEFKFQNSMFTEK